MCLRALADGGLIEYFGSNTLIQLVEVEHACVLKMNSHCTNCTDVSFVYVTAKTLTDSLKSYSKLYFLKFL